MHSFKHHSREHSDARTQGTFVRLPAWLYDLMVRLFIYNGKEQELRQGIIDLARLQSGEKVLDVGCGTGTLALIAKERVGETGRVSGIDPSAQLLTGAKHKAKRTGLQIDFQRGGIEQLPFPNQSFDVVLNTFVMHHLPDDLKRQGLTEIVRVLKPEGRLLIVDFKPPEEHHNGSGQFGAGEIGFQDIPTLMKEAGFSHMETGETPFRIKMPAGHQNSGFVLAKKRLTEEKSTSL